MIEMGRKGMLVPSVETTLEAAKIGLYRSPLGHGIVVQSKSEWSNDVEYHHFLTHDKNGKVLAMARHFIQVERHNKDGRQVVAGG